MAGFLKSLIPGDYPTLQILSFLHSVFDTEESPTYRGLRIWFYGYVTWAFDYSVMKGMIEMMHTGHSCRSFSHGLTLDSDTAVHILFAFSISSREVGIPIKDCASYTENALEERYPLNYRQVSYPDHGPRAGLHGPLSLIWQLYL